MSSVNNRREDLGELQVNLNLEKGIYEALKILAICYEDPTKNYLDNFISEEVTKIIHALAENPPEPPEFPESLKQHLKRLVKNESIDNNNNNKKEFEDLK